MHGLELQIEAVRQLRGESTSQVPGARVGLVISGPMVTPVLEHAPRHRRTPCERRATYLPAGLPRPVPEADGLDRPYWEGTRAGRALRAALPALPRLAVGTGVDLPPLPRPSTSSGWTVAPRGRIYSWERAWHPVHPALKDHGPYIVVLVELPHAGGVRMIGNLLGDPAQDVAIGAPVEAVFEPHDDADAPVHARALEEDHAMTPPQRRHRRRHQRAQSLAPGHARPRRLAAHRAARTIRGSTSWSRRTATPTSRPISGPRASTRSTASACRKVITDANGVKWRVSEGHRPDRLRTDDARGRGPAAPAGRRRSRASACATWTATASTPR